MKIKITGSVNWWEFDLDVDFDEELTEILRKTLDFGG